MGQRVGLEVSLACSEAVKLANVDVIAAYPITPQTHIVEHLSELVANKHLDAEFIPVESEHSAISACIGSSSIGARTFTSSASQGLALMHEILFIVSSLRLPVVMAVTNRALSSPISIWNDHSDIMAERDIGWIQFFAENGQEVMDLTITAFKIAEAQNVCLPVAINMDGFILTHVVEPIEILSQKAVNEYLPPFKPQQRLDIDNPISMGLVGFPEVYSEAKKASQEALNNSYHVIKESWNDFNDKFGRQYKPIETYKTKDAEIILVTMGSLSETAMSAIDLIREKGIKAGLLRIRLWRPFPKNDFINEIKNVENLIVIDRSLQLGSSSGPVATELKALLYDNPKQPFISEFIAGLGGRDVTRSDFIKIIEKSLEAKATNKKIICEIWGIKE